MKSFKKVTLSSIVGKSKILLESTFSKKKKTSKAKLDPIKLPQSFYDSFDDQDYLTANPDVAKSVKAGIHRDGLHHFESVGYYEVQGGGRRVGYKFPYFNASIYLNYNADLSGMTDSEAYEHFIAYGYKEHLDNQRLVVGLYPLPEDNKIIAKIKSNFDESAYLAVNPDISTAIEIGKIKSPWDHFISYGMKEIQEGSRPLNNVLGVINEADYLSFFPDLLKAIHQGLITSPLEHLLLHGAREIAKGERVIHAYGGYDYHEPVYSDGFKKELSGFASKPLISIIMPVYNVDPKWLDLAIKSIQRQWYTNWELCIADDASTNNDIIEYLSNITDDNIKIKFLKENGNISVASNEALSLASGDFIALMDNDDELTPDALFEVVKAINHTSAEFIYSDEDKLELSGRFVEPHFKPDFSADMFLSHNYISHLGVIKKSIVDSVLGWSTGLEGAQDYDLYLKVLEKTDKIYHIPKVLYHWRKVPGSTAADFSDKSYAQEAGRIALQNALRRRNITGEVEYGVSPGLYRVSYKIDSTPLVSIVVPFKDMPELLRQCIKSVLDKTNYSNYEIIGVSNNSSESETFGQMKNLSSLDERVSFYEFNEPFNYSRINNYAVNSLVKGDFIVFMNNDIEIISEFWIEEMLMLAQRENTGAVGAKLLYEDGTIQHAGIALAPGTQHLVIPVFSGFPRNVLGYSARLATVNNYTAVTAALLMVDTEKFKSVGGFDEVNFAVAYNDIDFCIKLNRSGLVNVYTPYAEAFHYESRSRGYDNESTEKLERMSSESYRLRTINEDYFENFDPSYNPNLSLESVGFMISGKVGRLNEPFVGKNFSEKIASNGRWSDSKSNRLCLFSHYDQDDLIDEYVVNYLESLSSLYDIVFVSTSTNLGSKELDKISQYCMSYIVKENYGYDFGAWKTGLDSIHGELDRYDYLMMCNDSVYGPLQPLKTVVSKMESEGYDVWSMSDNLEYCHHLQSYFIQYSKSAFQSELFEDTWINFKIFDDKNTLIKNYEIGLSNKFISSSEFKVGSYSSVLGETYLNPLQYYWDKKITEGFPFLKIEVLRRNPLNLDVSKYRDTIKKVSNYKVELIENHLKRVK
ncbi:glycosyltransferase [Leucothrix sargassi]|nr:glycosyltransferase [Leucothrix sargassi]